MEITYSFLGSDKKICRTALVQLRLVKDIVDRKIEVDHRLLKRCVKVKSSLNKFSRVITKINSLDKLKCKPWWYKPLSGDKYKGLSSVRLEKRFNSIEGEGDRLVFEESSNNKFIIIEVLFHYLRDLDTDNLTSTDKQLYQLYSNALTAYNTDKFITELYDLSLEKGGSKIWFFD